jgi:hypothetical protein
VETFLLVLFKKRFIWSEANSTITPFKTNYESRVFFKRRKTVLIKHKANWYGASFYSAGIVTCDRRMGSRGKVQGHFFIEPRIEVWSNVTKRIGQFG